MKATVLILCACLFAAPVWAGEGQPELLLGVTTDFDAGQIVFQVASGGCTTKEDFRFEFKNDTLTIFRMRGDYCKAMPHKVPITFALEELGISPHRPFALGNRIIVNQNLTGQ